MKTVLIIGANSYLGKNLETYLEGNAEYSVKSLSVKGDTWEREIFENVNVIYYVAAIVHRREKDVSQEEYYHVNVELPIKVAKKAKDEGVKQFIFVSTMSVYGVLSGYIDTETEEKPVTLYGKTKLQAERELTKFSSENFRVAVLRPPMIYGKGCKGNFARLEKLALLCPFFPKYDNKRSMLYIENLNAFVEQIIAKEREGLFFPQDAEWVSTDDMVRLIRRSKGKKFYGICGVNWLLNLLKSSIPFFEKIWGDLQYDQQMSQVENIFYQKYSLMQAICEIEE